MIQRRALSTIILIALTTPAAAGSTDRLADALAQLPVSALNLADTGAVWFVDIGAQRALAANAGSPEDYRDVQRTDFASSLRPVQALQGGIAPWEERAGMRLDGVSWFAGHGPAPRTLALWGLSDMATASTVFDGLPDKGFTPDVPMRGNGKPMAPDLASRDPSNPWRGALGQASFVATRDNVLLQSLNPETVQSALEAQDRVGALPQVKTALDGLDATLADGVVVQAVLVSPAVGLAGINLTSMLGTSDLGEMRAALEAKIEAQQMGVPPWFAGVIADVQLDHPGVAISLSFADCAAAKAAAAVMAAKWDATMREKVDAAPVTGVTEGSNGLCAATLTVSLKTDDPMLNRPANAVLSAYMKNDLDLVQIGRNPG